MPGRRAPGGGHRVGAGGDRPGPLPAEGLGRGRGTPRGRLAAIGVTPAEPAVAEEEPAVADDGVAAAAAEAMRSGVNGLAAMSAFQRGVAALARYRAREGHVRVPRQWVESLESGDGGGTVLVKLGGWLSNIKSPARRAKLTGDQLAVLAGLGLEWAGSTTS